METALEETRALFRRCQGDEHVGLDTLWISFRRKYTQEAQGYQTNEVSRSTKSHLSEHPIHLARQSTRLFFPTIGPYGEGKRMALASVP